MVNDLAVWDICAWIGSNQMEPVAVEASKRDLTGDGTWRPGAAFPG